MNKLNMVNKVIFESIKTRCKLYIFRDRVKKKFPESNIVPDNVFPMEYIAEMGRGSYGFFKAIVFGDVEECKIHFGHYNSIGQDVTFILGGEHRTDCLSTYPFDKRIFGEKDSARVKKGDIYLGDDVWIGYGATILSGVHIGQGAVIGAKSVVAKDVPPYTIYAGGKEIRKRYTDEIIEKLLQIDYSKLTKEMAVQYKETLENPIDTEWFEKHRDFIKAVGKRG